MTLVFNLFLKPHYVWKVLLAQSRATLVLDSAEWLSRSQSAKIRSCHAYKMTEKEPGFQLIEYSLYKLNILVKLWIFFCTHYMGIIKCVA